MFHVKHAPGHKYGLFVMSQDGFGQCKSCRPAIRTAIPLGKTPCDKIRVHVSRETLHKYILKGEREW